MNSVVVPIVFSSNESYAKYLSVAIQSVIECSDDIHSYKLFVLYVDMTKESIALLQQMSTEHVSVECVNVNAEWKHIESVLTLQNDSNDNAPCSHISKETYFHIFAPKLLSDEDYFIYSDCDVVFLRNPADLIEEIRKGDEAAVVYGVRNYSSVGTKVYVERHLNLSVENYINGGMFVINTKSAQKNGWTEICEGLLRRSSEFLFVDQDMINMALDAIPNGLSLIDPRWDFQWHPAEKSLLNMCKYTREDFIKARMSPYLIHYTSSSKPWKEPHKAYAEHFWKIAEKSPFFSQIASQKTDRRPELYTNAVGSGKPKVSVIIPAYNESATIARCIESVFNQTLSDIEIICIDDGSTDSTFDVMSGYLNKECSFKIIKEKKSGAAEARNAGIRNADGKYLYFLDADDYIEKEALQLLYDNAEQNGSDVVVFDTFQVDQHGNIGLPNAYLYKKYSPPDVFSPLKAGEYLFILTGASVWNKFYRADYINNKSLLFQQLDAADDTFFSMLSLAFADRISICNRRLIYHTIDRQESQMSGIEKYPLNQSKALMSVKQVLTEYDMFGTFEHSFVNRAAQNFVKTISRINTYSIFEQTYRKYREELFVKLGIMDKPKEYFFREELYTDILSVIERDCDKDVFENRKNFCSISGGKQK